MHVLAPWTGELSCGCTSFEYDAMRAPRRRESCHPHARAQASLVLRRIFPPAIEQAFIMCIFVAVVGVLDLDGNVLLVAKLVLLLV